MKLRNKKTGEIGEVGYLGDSDGKILVNNINDLDTIYEYDSLAELNEEWEDAPEEPKEPKKYWSINSGGETASYYEEDEEPEDTEACKAIGNYFETEEEAEKAVEKLKVWKRLKDKGAKIIDYACYGGTDTKGEFLGEIEVTIDVPHEIDKYLFELLFGGKE